MNCIIYKNNSDTVEHFIKDCVKKDNNFEGSNRKLYGIKPKHWSFKWTEDIVNPILDEEGNQIGWDKTVSEVVESDDSYEINHTTKDKYIEALKIRKDISNLTYDQIDTYINNNITDLASAKEYLKKLSKVVLAIIKMMDKGEN